MWRINVQRKILQYLFQFTHLHFVDDVVGSKNIVLHLRVASCFLGSPVGLASPWQAAHHDDLLTQCGNVSSMKEGQYLFHKDYGSVSATADVSNIKFTNNQNYSLLAL